MRWQIASRDNQIVFRWSQASSCPRESRVPCSEVLFRIRSIATFNTVDQQLFARVMQAVLGGSYKTYICNIYHWHVYCKLCPKPIFGCLRFCVTTQILHCARNFIAFGILSRNVHSIECLKNCGSSLRKRLSTHAAEALLQPRLVYGPRCAPSRRAEGWSH